jgi:hypothetical protein
MFNTECSAAAAALPDRAACNTNLQQDANYLITQKEMKPLK